MRKQADHFPGGVASQTRCIPAEAACTICHSADTEKAAILALVPIK